MAKAKQTNEQPPAVQEQPAATQPPERLSLSQLKEQHKTAKAESDALIEAAKTQEDLDAADEALKGVELLSRRISLLERGESQTQFLRRPNGTPPRVVPNQPIPGEEVLASAQEAGGFHSLAKPRAALPEGSVFKNEEEAYYASRWALALAGQPCNPTRNRKQAAAYEWFLANPEPFMAAGQNEFEDMAGGIFVPEQIMGPVERLKHSYGIARSTVNVVQTNRDVLKWPKGLTGASFSAIPEVNANNSTEVTMAADAVSIPVKDFYAFSRISRDLDEDAAVSIADMMVRQYADAAAYWEDKLVFAGDGTSTHAGIFGLTKAINGTDASASCYTATGITTLGALTLGNFEAMAGQLPDYPGASPKWYISKPAFYSSMARLMDAAGGNNIDALQRGTSGLQFLGYPVEFTRTLNTTAAGTSITAQYNVCLFGTPRLGATFADRRGMTVETNPYKYMAERQLAIYVTMRFGFFVHELTGLDGDQSTAIAGPTINLIMG
jgi:HK97 family phage major capsid protein